MGMRITNNPQTNLGIPEPKWGSIHPHTKTGIPESCSVTNQKQFGVRSNLGTDRTRPQIGTALKTGTPYWFGDPRISLGRDLSKFQIGESPDQFGVHSNLGTNISIKMGDLAIPFCCASEANHDRKDTTLYVPYLPMAFLCYEKRR